MILVMKLAMEEMDISLMIPRVMALVMKKCHQKSQKMRSMILQTGNATEYPANEGSAMLGVELPVEGNNPQVQEKPKDKFPIKVLLALSNCPMM